jgi:preprotein translocase subunit SecG
MNIYVIVAVLIFIICVLLILVVLVQNSKGGGLASNFSSSNQFMGVRKTADFLEKTTWTLAIALLVLSLVAVMSIPKSNGDKSTVDTELRDQATNSQPVNYSPAPKQDQGNQGGQTQPTPPAQ